MLHNAVGMTTGAPNNVQTCFSCRCYVKEMDFLYILFFFATTPTFANVYIFEVRSLKHYNFSQKHFQTLFRTKFLLCKVNRNN